MKKFLGVKQDPRTDSQKAKDWHVDEVLPSSSLPTVEWKEKKFKDVRFFSRRSQDGSGSCMAQSGVKVLGIDNFVEEGKYVELSARPVYKSRSNSDAGMWQQELMDILCRPIACFESQVPSQDMTEIQINEAYPISADEIDTAEIYRAGGYAFIPYFYDNFSIDKIASVIATGKAVQLVVFFRTKEWWGNQFIQLSSPDLKLTDTDANHHGIAAVDYGLWKGEKALFIEDSSVWKSENGQRVLTESWLKKRCYGAAFTFNLLNNHPVDDKPKHTFTKNLFYGLMNDSDVRALQDILKYEGQLSASIPSTGNYLSLTSQAVRRWQMNHSILDFQDETDVTKIRVGPKTITALNAIYAN